MQAGQLTGASVGTFTGRPNYQGTPDANGNMQTLDVLAGAWDPQQFAGAPGLNSAGGTNAVAAELVISANGRYTLTYSLSESGLWHAANGNWTRQVPSGGYSPPNTDGGTYTFRGRNQVSLFDQFGSSIWKRGS